MTVEVINESGVEVDVEDLMRIAQFVLDEMGVHPQVEMSVRAVDAEEMTRLHVQYMGEPGETDVLAFPMDELDDGRHDHDEELPPTYVGDVAVCPQVASRQAREAGHGTQDELRLLTTHGVLHLLGYDHHEPEEHREMFGLQAELLARWAEANGGAPAPRPTDA